MTPPSEPEAEPPPAQAIRARLDLPCELLEFQPPPVVVTLRLLERPDGWSLVLLSEEEDPSRLQTWLERHEDLARAGDTAVRGSTLSLPLDRLPPALSPLTDRVHLENLVVEPDGMAHLALRGSRDHLREIVEEAFPGDSKAHIRSVTSAEEGTAGDVLTSRQLEVLMRASTRGYYDVPRQISLRDLAAELQMSPAALSELLRRTEARLVERFLDALATAPEVPLEALAAKNQLTGRLSEDP